MVSRFLPTFKRDIQAVLADRLRGANRFIQVLAGPRQTGKTTIALQTLASFPGPSHYATADEPALKDRAWIGQQWEAARSACRSAGGAEGVLVLDEIQKIPEWSETVKRLWDEDRAAGALLHVVLLGSSTLLVRQGLADSLAGRFEILHVPHWSFREMRDAFGWDADRYIFHGGYPGAAALADDPDRWLAYVSESLIETTVSRDILLMKRVDKPALLRRLFELGCRYSGRVLSYQKMMGQLQDAGNATTLAHYLSLLESAGLLMGIPKYAGRVVRRRASSPKLQAMNTALVSASSGRTFEETRRDPAAWGRLVETAVGAHLANASRGTPIDLFYWAGRNREVDFVLSRGGALAAIEVKSGREKESLPGLKAFAEEFPVTRNLLVGAGGIPIEEFLLRPAEDWVR